MKKRSKKVKAIVAVMAVAAVVVLGGAGIFASQASDETILDGVYVGDLAVGGMSQEQAMEEVDTYVKGIMEQPVTLQVEERSVKALSSEMGLSYSAKDLVDEAYGVGHSGNLIKRYKERQDLKHENVKVQVSMDADYEMVKTFLESNLDSLNQKTVNNGLKRENGQFVFVEGAAGIVVDVEKSAKSIVEYFAKGVTNSLGAVDLVSEVEQPKGTKEELSSVKDVLGSFSTDYSTSAPGRCQNVENATSLINGTVLYPGDTFSVHDTISPITLDNGYAMAGAYENGTVVESVGGGVCQVSSTLYNAIIKAELEIVERFPHSMIVKYVKPSQDAAIAGDYKDFKFKNNGNSPIYIEGYTAGKMVYFNVYGCETREANREVSYESETISTNEPEPKFQKSNAPIGTVTRIQEPHIGYKAVLYKVVKVDGKVVSREKFNSSNYSASAAIYEVGTKSSNKDAVKAIKEAIATGDLAKIKSAAAKWNEKALKEKEEEEKKKEEQKKEDKKDQEDKDKDKDKDKEEAGEE